MKMRFIATIFLGLILIFGAAYETWAEELATLTGRVTDAQGLALPGVKVQAVNINTNVVYSGESNREGIYQIPYVPPGTYRVVLQKTGFSQIVKPGVELHVQDVITLNFAMPVGSITETVTVEAGASMINTTDASVSTVVDQSYVKNMPLNGRSFQDLILLTPGVVTQTPQGNGGYGSPGMSGEFSVNGQRTEENYYTVDGVSGNVGANGEAGLQSAGPSGSVASSTALGTTQALVSVDELQELRVQSSTYSAEYGRNPGAQIAFQTKSGTNAWHGTAYDYLRNDFVDANDWFNNYFGTKEPPLRQNDFGGTLGGPISIPRAYNGKDRAFFFTSYEGLRLIQPQPASLSTVPDACMRGDTASCDPARAPAASALLPVVNAFPVPNGPNFTVPCNPATDPTCPASGQKQTGAARFSGAWSNPSSLDSGSVRLDQVIGSRAKLFFRFNETRSDSAFRRARPFSPSDDFVSSNTMRTYTAGVTNSVTSRLTNDFRLNYTSNVSGFDINVSPVGGSSPADLVQLAGSGAGTGTLFRFRLAGRFLFLMDQPFTAASRQWNLVDTVSYSLGRHQLKFGADYRRESPFSKSPPAFFSYTYFSEKSVEANNAGIEADASNPGYPLYRNFSAFVQDEIRMTQRLSLSMGLRWEVNPAPGVTQGLNAYTIQGSTPDTWALAPQGTPLWKTTWYNFAPRLGAAYMVRSTPGREAVIRAGGGLFFDSGQQLASLGYVFGPGFSASNFSGGPFPGPASLVPAIQQPPDPASTGQPVYGFYPHLQLPYTIQWNASIEQALGRVQAVTLSYVGSHASRLLQQNTYNTPNNVNGISSFFFVQNGLTSDYDSAQVQFRRNLSRGLTALGSYGWSHCVDYGSSNFLTAYSRGNCDFDVRHNLSAAFSYDLPSAGHGGILGAVLHHWGVDDRIMARSSFPVTLFGTGFINGPALVGPTGQVVDEGLDLVQGQPVYLYGANCATTLQGLGDLLPGQGCPGGKAINPNAFAPVPTDPITGAPTRQGTAPRNFARGFGAWQMNLAVRREFPVYERLKLQFRAEAFNLFNHPNFGIVDPNLGDPTFGQSTATLANSLGILSPLYQMGGPRSMQFALKLIF